MADSFTDDGDGDASRPAAPLPHARDATPLLDDPNDDFCRVCGFGVRCLALITVHIGCLRNQNNPCCCKFGSNICKRHVPEQDANGASADIVYNIDKWIAGRHAVL